MRREPMVPFDPAEVRRLIADALVALDVEPGLAFEFLLRAAAAVGLSYVRMDAVKPLAESLGVLAGKTPLKVKRKRASPKRGP